MLTSDDVANDILLYRQFIQMLQWYSYYNVKCNRCNMKPLLFMCIHIDLKQLQVGGGGVVAKKKSGIERFLFFGKVGLEE